MPFTGECRGPGTAPRRCTIDLAEDLLSVSMDGGEVLTLALVDLDDVHDDNYVLRLTDHTGAIYELGMLGKAYGQLAAELARARNAALERDLLLRGVGLRDSFPGKLFGEGDPRPVELRVYEDLLVIVPRRGTMFGVPYSFVERVDWDPDLYQVRVATDDGGLLVLGHLAKRSEEFRDELTGAIERLGRRTVETIGALAPGLRPEVLAGLGTLMRDGRAVQQRAVDAIDPGAWAALENAVVATPELRASYEHLAEVSPPGWTAFGIKAVRAEGAEDGTPRADLWYFCPLAHNGRPVNAVAQEVTSETGHATYVFRLMDPERFASLGDDLADEVGRAVSSLNRALLLLNFRREPIYLTEEQIVSGSYSRYAVALRKLPYLRAARDAFIGRATHNASWADQVAALVDRV